MGRGNRREVRASDGRDAAELGLAAAALLVRFKPYRRSVLEDQMNPNPHVRVRRGKVEQTVKGA